MVMKKCDELLITHSKSIEQIIDLVNKDNRAIISQIMLTNLRHFVEHAMLKIYCEDKRTDLNDDWANIQAAIKYSYSHNQYSVLSIFHKKHLQKSVSHKVQDLEYSETLALMYIKYLAAIKSLLKTRYSFDVLTNLDRFPLDLDNTFYNYYLNIQRVVLNDDGFGNFETDYYYVYRKRPILLGGKVIYELTLGPVNDFSDKFDRFLVFSSFDVFDNYAIEAFIVNRKIDYFDAKITIKILTDYNVSIRTYELNNIAKILCLDSVVKRKQTEFSFVMKYIKENSTSLDEIAQYSESDFNSFKQLDKHYAGSETPILDILTASREIMVNNKAGSNVLRYLLCHTKNTTIKRQMSDERNVNISSLRLKNGTLVFDETPFAGNLIKSREPLSYLFDCIDFEGCDCQLLARRITEISDSTGQLYVFGNKLAPDTDLNKLIKDFNQLIPAFQRDREIGTFHDYVYIKENEANTIRILRYLLRSSKTGISGYSNQAKQWISKNGDLIKGDEKKEILEKLFDKSKVFALYGAAGTGKSTTVSFIFKILNKVTKLCLAATHPAVENMRRKIADETAEYYTISKFLADETIRRDWDIVVIDECSVVSNQAMISLLNVLNFSALLLTGDIYQLPSINFGNWFHIIKSILPMYSWAELKKQFRTDDNVLLELWNKVRNNEHGVYEFMSHNGMTKILDESVFDSVEEDQIILCYNYDGLYGINSINRYLQEKNKNEPVSWKQYIFKVGDPVIFNNTKRFNNLLYNNLKGRIMRIVKDEERITFDIAIDLTLSEINFRFANAKFVKNLENGWTVIRFSVYNLKKQDEDVEPEEIHSIPFQLSYAVSIHKSQGLEYKSVKVIIANNVDELITHNVFYTAITRAKEKLMVYWTPETAAKVLSSFEPHFDAKDGAIIKKKMMLTK